MNKFIKNVYLINNNNNNKIYYLLPEIYHHHHQHSNNVNDNRQFFTFPKLTNKRKEYRRTELVGYSMEQMYSAVADVDNYVKFVPYCKKSYVFDRKGQTSAKANLIVGFPPLYETYTSNLTFIQPNLVKSECFDGRLFNYLLNYWGFSAGVKDVPNSCVVDFRVTFEFKSALHSNVANIFFDLIIQQMETAFMIEAKRRYGDPVIESRLIERHKS